MLMGLIKNRRNADKNILFLGLSARNLTRLQDGVPIHIGPGRMKIVGMPPIHVVIHYGQTEEGILEELRKSGVEMESLQETG